MIDETEIPFPVLHRHYAGATRYNPIRCPVGLALKEAIEKQFPGVPSFDVICARQYVTVIVDPAEGGLLYYHAQLPPEGQQIIADFDAGKENIEAGLKIRLGRKRD